MNYSELVGAVKAYADRQDIEVDNNMDTFILMAEARINRVLKTREQTHRVFTPTAEGQEYYVLPPDYAGMRDIQLNSNLPSEEHSTTPMEYISPQLMNERANGVYAGKIYYSIIANQLQVFPVQDSGKSFEIVYYRRVPNLNTANTTNWLSDSHPDIYLCGMLAELEAFVKNYEVSKAWDDKMSRSIAELDTSDTNERWGGSPLHMRLA